MRLRSESSAFLLLPQVKSVCCCVFVQIDEALSLFIFRSATRNAARSVPSPMGHTAVMAHAAITHVWYEFGLFLKLYSTNYKCILLKLN